jgi:hypothetical protein
VQSVTSITLVAEMPNPDGLEEFGPVWAELEARRARLISTRMVAANEDEGLQGLEVDERVQGNLAMGRQGFGYVEARGRRDGRERFYDQRGRVAREVTDEIGQTWEAAAQTVLETTRQTGPNILGPRTRPRRRR